MTACPERSRGVRGVLFDLDDTLFDHNHATISALAELCAVEPAFLAWPAEELRARHSAMLEELHTEVVAGRVSLDDARHERFRRLLAAVSDAAHPAARPMQLAHCYRNAYKQSYRPVAGAPDLLKALRDEGVAIGIVTNNLTAEQQLKLERCGLDSFIDALITSEDAGIAKPDPAIFVKALDRLQVRASDAVMVGDAWATDIEGALAASIRPVWFNWRGQAAPAEGVTELRSLEPLSLAAQAIRFS